MWTSLKRYHFFYQRKGFYQFLRKIGVNFAAIMLPILLALLLFENFTPGMAYYFGLFAAAVRQELVLGFFFISETLLGLVPPDLFIIWAKQFTSPYVVVAILALLSYGAGLLAYYMGVRIVKLNRLGHLVHVKFAKQVAMLRNWGAPIIIVAALLPLPYSTMCLGAGMLKFSFRSLMFLGVFRIARFFVYALVLFQFV